MSIALGASLIGVVDYRVLVAVMAVVLTGCAVYLFGRPRETLVVTVVPMQAEGS